MNQTIDAIFDGKVFHPVIPPIGRQVIIATARDITERKLAEEERRKLNLFLETTWQYGGTGLGLAISRQLAELMGVRPVLAAKKVKALSSGSQRALKNKLMGRIWKVSRQPICTAFVC